MADSNAQPQGHSIEQLMLQVAFCHYCGSEPQCLTEIEDALQVDLVACPLASSFSETAGVAAFEWLSEQELVQKTTASLTRSFEP